MGRVGGDDARERRWGYETWAIEMRWAGRGRSEAQRWKSQEKAAVREERRVRTE